MLLPALAKNVALLIVKLMTIIHHFSYLSLKRSPKSTIGIRNLKKFKIKNWEVL
jgi:hypothetical protein